MECDRGKCETGDVADDVANAFIDGSPTEIWHVRDAWCNGDSREKKTEKYWVDNSSGFKNSRFPSRAIKIAYEANYLFEKNRCIKDRSLVVSASRRFGAENRVQSHAPEK
jgi:hypothetical protein